MDSIKNLYFEFIQEFLETQGIEIRSGTDENGDNFPTNKEAAKVFYDLFESKYRWDIHASLHNLWEKTKQEGKEEFKSEIAELLGVRQSKTTKNDQQTALTVESEEQNDSIS